MIWSLLICGIPERYHLVQPLLQVDDFLRVAGDAGHGQGMALSSSIAQEADVETFLFDQLGIDQKAPVAP